MSKLRRKKKPKKKNWKGSGKHHRAIAKDEKRERTLTTLTIHERKEGDE